MQLYFFGKDMSNDKFAIFQELTGMTNYKVDYVLHNEKSFFVNAIKEKVLLPFYQKYHSSGDCTQSKYYCTSSEITFK